MFSISDTAAEKAKEILTAEGKADWGLRIFVSEGGCCGPSFEMDIDEKPGNEDLVTEKNGLKVFTDKRTHEGLKGLQMDYIVEGDQEGFVIRAEGGNQAPSCGCGGGKSCH